jgi:hypothetical protein
MIKAGTLVMIVNEGSVEEDVLGLARATRDVDLEAEMEAYLLANPKVRDRMHWETDDFLRAIDAFEIVSYIEVGFFTGHEEVQFSGQCKGRTLWAWPEPLADHRKERE